LPREPNVIYIGRKPTMSYVLAVITRRRFMKELNISKITIGTEEIQQKETFQLSKSL